MKSLPQPSHFAIPRRFSAAASAFKTLLAPDARRLPRPDRDQHPYPGYSAVYPLDNRSRHQSGKPPAGSQCRARTYLPRHAAWSAHLSSGALDRNRITERRLRPAPENSCPARQTLILLPRPDRDRSTAFTVRSGCRKNTLQAMSLSFMFLPAVDFLGVLATGIVLLYGGLLVARGEITLGIVVAFIAYVTRFFQPIQDLSQLYTTMQSAMASCGVYQDLYLRQN